MKICMILDLICFVYFFVNAMFIYTHSIANFCRFLSFTRKKNGFLYDYKLAVWKALKLYYSLKSSNEVKMRLKKHSKEGSK